MDEKKKRELSIDKFGVVPVDEHGETTSITHSSVDDTDLSRIPRIALYSTEDQPSQATEKLAPGVSTEHAQKAVSEPAKGDESGAADAKANSKALGPPNGPNGSASELVSELKTPRRLRLESSDDPNSAIRMVMRPKYESEHVPNSDNYDVIHRIQRPPPKLELASSSAETTIDKEPATTSVARRVPNLRSTLATRMAAAGGLPPRTTTPGAQTSTFVAISGKRPPIRLSSALAAALGGAFIAGTFAGYMVRGHSDAAPEAAAQIRALEDAVTKLKVEKQRLIVRKAAAQKETETFKKIAYETAAKRQADEGRLLAREATAQKKVEELKQLVDELNGKHQADEERLLANEAEAQKKIGEFKRLADEAEAKRVAEAQERAQTKPEIQEAPSHTDLQPRVAIDPPKPDDSQPSKIQTNGKVKSMRTHKHKAGAKKQMPATSSAQKN